jgi:hypothetical protein
MAKDKQSAQPTLTREEPIRKAATTTSTDTTTTRTPFTRPTVSDPSRLTAALPFGRQNYTLMLAGIGIILAGFFIMSLDKEEFGFGFLGLTLGPIVVMAGFILEFFVILARPKQA